MNLALSQIRLDGGTQSRASLNEQTIADYCDAMADGEEFPPVVVFHDGSTYWLADGFHRVRAAERACLVEIEADVRQGGRRDAVLFSVGANSSHGLRRTNEDKKRAVLVLLEDAEWSKWSNNAIAKQASVGDHLVAKIRSSLTSSGRSEQPSERTYKTKHGTTATMQTANIGAKKPPPAAVDTPEADLPPRSVEESSRTPKLSAAERVRLTAIANGEDDGEAEEEDEGQDEFNPHAAAAELFKAMATVLSEWPIEHSLDPLISVTKQALSRMERTKEERLNG